MLVVFVLTFSLPLLAQRQVAITVDDLPIGGDGTGCSFKNVRAVNAGLLKPSVSESFRSPAS